MSKSTNEKPTINVTELTSIQTIFLFVLHRHPNSTGTDIVSIIEKEIGKDWIPTPGATYKILSRLHSAGCIIETTDLNNSTDGRKRTYELSQCGYDFVKQQSDRMLRLVGFLYDCCPQYSTTYKIIRVTDNDCC